MEYMKIFRRTLSVCKLLRLKDGGRIHRAEKTRTALEAGFAEFDPHVNHPEPREERPQTVALPPVDDPAASTNLPAPDVHREYLGSVGPMCIGPIHTLLPRKSSSQVRVVPARRRNRATLPGLRRPQPPATHSTSYIQ